MAAIILYHRSGGRSIALLSYCTPPGGGFWPAPGRWPPPSLSPVLSVAPRRALGNREGRPYQAAERGQGVKDERRFIRTAVRPPSSQRKDAQMANDYIIPPSGRPFNSPFVLLTAPIAAVGYS